MSPEYSRFLNPETQHANYKLIGIDKSITEVNQRLFWENNSGYFGMAEKYKAKKKGVDLKGQASIDTFINSTGAFGKFKRKAEPIKLNKNDPSDRPTKKINQN
jgi:hypothetical protein